MAESKASTSKNWREKVLGRKEEIGDVGESWRAQGVQRRLNTGQPAASKRVYARSSDYFKERSGKGSDYKRSNDQRTDREKEASDSPFDKKYFMKTPPQVQSLLTLAVTPVKELQQGQSQGVGSQSSSVDNGNRGPHRRDIESPRGNHPAPNPRPERRPPNRQRIDCKVLLEISEKEPAETLHYIGIERYGFLNLLNSPILSSAFISLMMKILANALRCTMSRQTHIAFMIKLKSCPFLSFHVAVKMAGMLTGGSVQLEQRQFIDDFLTSVQILLTHMPSFYEALVPSLATLEAVILKKGIDDVLLESSKQLLAEIKSIGERIETVKENQPQGNDVREVDVLLPPNDFREISIFPTRDDIYVEEEIFLRENLRKGAFQDADHYLDVQFRLLREDFVAPLRDGISHYNHLLEAQHGPNGPRVRVQEIRIYNSVRVISPICSQSKGITYQVSFDTRPFAKVRWEVSRRLIFGSLLCLSKDNFATMFFATVTNRDAKGLANGELEIHFEHDHEKVSSIMPDEIFTMAESTAFFEAYRHVLRGLQELKDESFPFQKYIVFCSSNVNTPNYLQPKDMFDLLPLAKKEGKLEEGFGKLKLSDAVDVGEEDQKSVPRKSSRRCDVQILEIDSWPARSMFGLDKSQYVALQTALCREFSIIQGPPGTGKTYVGLKIAQALLHNRDSWCKVPHTDQVDKRPILVVCYTNHALDQFLEGIRSLGFKEIVRSGARSQSKVLESYLLTNLRRTIRSNHEVPVEVYQGRQEAREEMNDIEAQINKIGAKLQATQKGILHTQCLQPFIDGQHYFDLNRLVLSGEMYRTKQLNIMLEWLGMSESFYQLDETTGEMTVEDAELAESAEIVEEEDEKEISVEDEAQREEEMRTDENKTDKERREKKARELQLEVNSYVALSADDVPLEVENRNKSNDGFRVVQKKNDKRRQRMLKRKLANSDSMSTEEVAQIDDVWAMKLDDRWRLYRYWLTEFQKTVKADVRQLERQYDVLAQRHEEILFREDLAIMRNAMVLGMTTTNAARYRRVLQEIKPKIVIVEEAAEVLESHIVTTLTESCQHLILIGDHKQLRPNPCVYKLAKKYNLEVSLFERMVNNKVPFETLERQHRMRPSISILMKNIYPNLQDDISVLEYESIKGLAKDVFFIDHRQPETGDEELKSKSNLHEAVFLTQLCRYLIQQGYEPKQITILTPYTGQIFALKKLLPRKQFEGARVTAVDNFQGEENDIILLSLVRSNDADKIGFLGEDNRVCVALSRAKKGFYVIGNMEFLARNSPLWKKMVKTLMIRECIGSSLVLKCQNHPNDAGLEMTCGNDFNNAPEGGCNKPCETRLACGHVCRLACHSYDRDHKEYKCQKPCVKVLCDLGHKCIKQCHEKCGKCMTRIPKLVTKCNHEQMVPCSQPENEFICLEPCFKLLPCSHQCDARCGEPHTQNCQAFVRYRWPCGHSSNIRCFMANAKTPCPEPCRKELACNHTCPGKCGECFEGRIHIACSEPCGRTLICGHQCLSPCAESCPPCQRPCENRCAHGRCRKLCGVPCELCVEPCDWRCQHQRCTKLCHEVCDRRKCDEPCEKRIRKCGHQCIGLCGEACPIECRMCHKATVREIFFGLEDARGARFIRLEDCDHFIEVSAMDQWMGGATDTSEHDLDIQLKACPKCKTPIRRNHRYGAIINEMLTNIEAVKVKLAGSKKDVEAKRKNIIEKDLRELEEVYYHVASIYGHKIEMDKLHDVVEGSLTIDELFSMENAILFLTRLCKLMKDFKNLFPKGGEVSAAEKLQQLKEDALKLFGWLLKHLGHLKSQQITETDQEISRLSLLQTVLSFQEIITTKKVDLSAELDRNLKHSEKILTNRSPLNKMKEEFVTNCVGELKKQIPRAGTSLGISDDEKKMIVSAMAQHGISKGHWFKCPNGHVYAIGDCGGANEKSKCPECKAVIGGANHQLEANNALATEMDGAQNAAWSEMNNILNFNIPGLGI